MSVKQNKAIARRLIQVWGKGDLNLIDELANPKILVRYPAIPQELKGKDEFKKFLREFHSAFPDANIDVEDEIAEGDKVVISWSESGTHKGNLAKMPPTGKKVRWTGVTIYKIDNGKVTEEKGEEDGLGLMRQIGAIPPMV